MKKFLSMIVLASIVVACSDDPEIDANVGRKIDIFAKTELTRTQLGADELQLLWEPNETIGVFGNATTNAAFRSANTEAAETATFSGEVAENDNTLMAYYPYVEGATNLGAIPFTLATDQEQTGNVPALAVNDLKFGQLVDQGNNKYACTFQQCFSLVKLTVNLINCDKVAGYHLESLWLQSDDVVMTGDFNLNMSTGALSVGEATSDNVNLEFTDKPALTDEIKGWVILNPNVPAESTINVLLTAVDANGENTITATAELKTLQALEAGCAYNIPLEAEFMKFQVISLSTSEINFEANGGVETVTVTSDYENVVAASDADWVTVEKTSDTEYVITAAANESSVARTATVTFTAEDETCKSINITQAAAEVGEDDTETETANCYMITAAGDYSFNATVMGNGASGVIADVGFHTTDAVITGGASAELLWQDTAGFITSVSYDSTKGRINYTAGSNCGNAVIAVKNSAGTILWSWHIWGTGDRAVQDDVYTNQAGATFTVMDRNLGQLKMIYSTDLHTEGEPMYVKQDDGTLYSEKAAAVETINCTLYQWGRKDPVPSAATRYNINNEATDISTSYPVLNYNNFSSADEATIEYSIQNPAYLIDTYKYTSNQIWEKDGNAYLWGGGSSTTYVQYMDNTSAVAGWENEKTIYDPCPAGYRVANPYTWTGFVGGTASGGTGRDGTITLNNAPASTFVDYNKDGVFSDDEKLTSWDTTNDVAIVDGEEKLKQDLRAIVSYYQVDYTNTKWVIKSGDYLLSSTEDTEGAVECNYITRYYAPVYCQGLFFMSDENDKTGSFYPMISYRNGSNGSFNTAGLGYYWSSGPGGSTANAYYLKLGAYSYKSSGNSLSIDVFDNKGKRDAQPVRCVKY